MVNSRVYAIINSLLYYVRRTDNMYCVKSARSRMAEYRDMRRFVRAAAPYASCQLPVCPLPVASSEPKPSSLRVSESQSRRLPLEALHAFLIPQICAPHLSFPLAGCRPNRPSFFLPNLTLPASEAVLYKFRHEMAQTALARTRMRRPQGISRSKLHH
jgi:hypothetical protein